VLTLLLGASAMAEVAVAGVPYALLWQLGAAWVACSVALGLREGRRWALFATVVIAVCSPGLAMVAAPQVGPAGTVPCLLAPVALALLIPAKSARWLRRRPVRLTIIPTQSPAAPVPALLTLLATGETSNGVGVVQSDYALAGAIAPGRVSR
jgi:hypothetical protein